MHECAPSATLVEAMASQPSKDGVNVSKPSKRIRWATQRVGKTGGEWKRKCIMRRLSLRNASTEKKRASDNSASMTTPPSQADGVTTESPDEAVGEARRLFFNMHLPKDASDENGKPLVHFPRNKIRTAKYTPLTFIPKNLWYQFHNIANVYFFFLIVLGVSSQMLSRRHKVAYHIAVF